MANTVNGELTPSTWTFVATNVAGSIVNPGIFDMQVVKSDSVPGPELVGIIVSPGRGFSFPMLGAGVSIYARCRYEQTYVFTPV